MVDFMVSNEEIKIMLEVQRDQKKFEHTKKFCPNCGMESQVTSKFCFNCGTPLPMFPFEESSEKGKSLIKRQKLKKQKEQEKERKDLLKQKLKEEESRKKEAEKEFKQKKEFLKQKVKEQRKIDKKVEKARKNELKNQMKLKKQREDLLKNINYYERKLESASLNLFDVDYKMVIASTNNLQIRNNLDRRRKNIRPIKLLLYSVWVNRDILNNEKSKEVLVKLDLMNYMDGYVKKYLDSYSNLFYSFEERPVENHCDPKSKQIGDIISLKRLLQMKGASLSYKDLLLIVYERMEPVSYDYLKLNISKSNPKNLNDYVNAFVEIFTEYYKNMDYIYGLGSFYHFEYFRFNKKMFLKLLNDESINCTESLLDEKLSNLIKENDIIDLEKRLFN